MGMSPRAARQKASPKFPPDSGRGKESRDQSPIRSRFLPLAKAPEAQVLPSVCLTRGFWEKDITPILQGLQDLAEVFGIADVVRPPNENETNSG
jgi:hypothetical protein